MTWTIIGSHNAEPGFSAAVELLEAGGSATDAVIAAIRVVERKPDEHSVGYSGLPNLLGEVELDASLMEGRGRRAGAVAAVKRFGDVTDLARQVMDRLPHSFLVGEGAERFAVELGMSPEVLLTPEATAVWQGRMENRPRDGGYLEHMAAIVGETTSDPRFPELPHGTVNVIALDSNGDLCSGVSTSGWAWKYPGRVGDSPVIGAGNYADNRYGAAACTGRGEMALRCCTAHSVVMWLRMGRTLEDALILAAEDLRELDDPYASEMNVVAIDRDGRYGAVSTSPGKTYLVQSSEDSTPLVLQRIHVPL